MTIVTCKPQAPSSASDEMLCVAQFLLHAGLSLGHFVVLPPRTLENMRELFSVIAWARGSFFNWHAIVGGAQITEVI